jgi:hypothetical protein
MNFCVQWVVAVIIFGENSFIILVLWVYGEKVTWGGGGGAGAL